jgi:hypothetical protein
MATFGEHNTPVTTKTTIPSSQIIQRVTSRLQGVESAIQTIGSLLGNSADNGSIGGTVYARITHLQGQLMYELNASGNNTTLLGAAGRYYYDPTQFKAGIVDRRNKGTNVRMALTDLDNSVGALGNHHNIPWETYSLSTGTINHESKDPASIPQHLGLVRGQPYSSEARGHAYNPNEHLLPNRIVRHGSTVKEALEAINELVGDVGPSKTFQYLGSFTNAWLGGNLTIKACFQKIAEKIDSIDSDHSSQAQLNALIARVDQQEDHLASDKGDLASEVNRAKTAENVLEGKIDEEKNRAIGQETGNAANIAIEQQRAEGAETALNNRIDQESARANGEENNLTAAINVERDRAIGKETKNAADIVLERQRAVAKEEDLGEKVDKEAERAQGMEATNASAVVTERERARGAEAANASAVVTERERALQREGEITGLVGVETQRATNEEQNIREEINTRISTVTGITDGILTNTIPPIIATTNNNETKANQNASTLATLQGTVAQNHTSLTSAVNGIQTTIDQLLEVDTGTAGDIGANQDNIAANLSKINAQADLIAGNTGATGANLAKIDANTALGTTHGEKIATHESLLSKHEASTEANTAKSISNESQHGANATKIAQNLQTISANSGTIASQASQLITVSQTVESLAGTVSGISSTASTSAGNIASNLARINAQATVVAENTTASSTNLGNISSNASNIQANTERIDNILENTTSEALDSLAEVVHAFQEADKSLNGTITTLTSSIAGNAASNLVKINSNTASIDNNGSLIESNRATMEQNAGAISSLSGTASTSTENIASNLARIDAQATLIAENTASVSSNLVKINANATASANNLLAINANHATATSNHGLHGSRIASAEASVQSNASNIDANTVKISANLSSLTTHAGTFVEHLSRINANTLSSGNNAQGIASNLQTMQQNNTTLGEHAAKIQANTNSISGQSAAIQTNANGISSNSTKINEVNSKVDLLGNIEGGDLTQLVGRVTSLETDVSTLSSNGSSERNAIREDVDNNTAALNSLNSLDDLVWDKALLPSVQGLDAGSASIPIENVYANTLLAQNAWVNDWYTLGVAGNELVAKRRTGEAPSSIRALDKTTADAQAFANKSELTLEDWVDYYRHVSGIPSAHANDVFSQPSDFDETIVLNNVNSTDTTISALTSSVNNLTSQNDTNENTIAEHSNTLQTLGNGVSENRETLQTLGNGVSENQERLDNILKDATVDLDSLKEVVDAFQSADSNLTTLATSVQTRVGAVEEKNNQQGTALAQQGTALAQHETALAQQGTALAQHETALAQHETALAQQGAALAQHETTLTQQGTTLAQQGADIQQLGQSITSETSRLDQSIENERNFSLGARSTLGATLTSKIDGLTSEVGEETLFDPDQTVKGSINALKTAIDNQAASETVLQNTQKIQENASRIDNILSTTTDEALDSLSEIVGAFQQADANLNQALTTLTTGTDQKIGAVETSVAGLQEAKTDHETKINQHSTQLADHTALLSGHTSQLAGHAPTIQQHTVSLGLHGERLNAAEALLAANTGTIASLSSGLETERTRAQNQEALLQANIDKETAKNAALDTIVGSGDLSTSLGNINLTAGVNTLHGNIDSVNTLIGNVSDLPPNTTNIIQGLNAVFGAGQAGESPQTFTNTTSINTLNATVDTIKADIVALETNTADTADTAATVANTENVSVLQTTVGTATLSTQKKNLTEALNELHTLTGANATSIGNAETLLGQSIAAERARVDGLVATSNAHDTQITEHQAGIAALQNNTAPATVTNTEHVSALQTTVGAATLTTVKNNLTEAVNELHTLTGENATATGAETTRAQNAEAALSQGIATEKARVDSEVTRAQHAEAGLSQGIATEKARVDGLVTTTNEHNTQIIDTHTQIIALDQKLQDTIGVVPEHLDTLSEIATAFQNADTNLNTLVTNLSASSASNLATEKARALAAEQQNTDNIAQNTSALAQHAQTIAQNTQTIAQNTQTIAQHGTTVAQHGTTLAQHGTTVAQHGTTVAQHTQAIAQNAQGAGQNTTTLAQHALSIGQNAALLGGATALTTTSNTLTGAVNEIRAQQLVTTAALGDLVSQQDVSTNTAAIAAVQTTLGSEPLFDTDISIRKAVNTVKQNVDTTSANLSAEITRAAQKEQENANGLLQLTGTVSALQNDVTNTETGVAALQQDIGTGSIANGNTIKAAINSLLTSVGSLPQAGDVSTVQTQANANAANIISNASSLQAIHATLGTATLATNASTVLQAINEVNDSITVEKARAETAEAAQATSLQAETARATQEEQSIRALVGTGALGVGSTVIGAINTLLAQINVLSGSLSTLETLVKHQKTLIVAGTQDHRATDLTLFSEIIVQGTLIITTPQADAIQSKTKTDGSEWTLAFTKTGTVREVHNNTVKVVGASPLFDEIVVQSGTIDLPLELFQSKVVTKEGTGVVIVSTSSAEDLRTADLTHVSELRLGADITLSTEQLPNVTLTNPGQHSVVVVVATGVTSTLTAPHFQIIASVRVEGTLVLSPEAASQQAAKITKQGQGKVVAQVGEGTHDIRGLLYAHVDVFRATNAVVLMSPGQANHFTTELTGTTTVKLVEDSAANYLSYQLDGWDFDELLLQNSTLTVSPEQADHLTQKIVEKSNSTVMVHATQETNLSSLDLSVADSLVLGANVTVGPHQNLPVNKQGHTITLLVEEDANVSLSQVPFDSAHVPANKTLRVSPSQYNSMAIAGPGETRVVVQGSGTLTDAAALPQTLELSSNVQVSLSLQQLVGKSIVKSSGAILKALAGGSNVHSIQGPFPSIDVLELTENTRISTLQYQSASAVAKQQFLLTLRAENESLTGMPSLGFQDVVETHGSVTMSALQFTQTVVDKQSGTINLSSDQTIDLSGASLAPIDALAHTNGTLTLTAAQIQSFPSFEPQASVMVLVRSSVVYSSRLDSAASIVVSPDGSLDYTADSTTDLVTTGLLNKVSSTTGGALTLRNMYKAPPSHLINNGTLYLPKTGLSGGLLWENDRVTPLNPGETATVVDGTQDPHAAQPQKEYQWQRDAGLGYVDIPGATATSYTVQNADIGGHLRLKVQYTIDWYRVDPSDKYDAAFPALARQSLSNPLFVNTTAVASLTTNGAPTLAANLVANDTVSVAISDPDGIQGTPVYGWKRNGVATGPSGNAYTITSLDFGSILSVSFQYTDQKGAPESGTAVVGTLPSLVASCSVSEVSAQASLPSVQLTHGVVPNSVTWYSYPHGGSKAVSTVYTDNILYATTGTMFYARASTAEGVVVETEALPVREYSPMGSIVVSGIVAEQETLSIVSTVTDVNMATASNPQGSLSPTDFSIEWYRSSDSQGTQQTVVGTNVNYVVQLADLSNYIGLNVTYTDGSTQHTISSSLKYSNQDGQLTLTTTTSTDRPIAVNKMVAGDKIQASLEDADSIAGSVVYQWSRGGSTLPTTGSVHVLGTEDFSTTLKVQATYTDQQGRTETISEEIVLGAEPNVFLTDISGTALTGSLLSPVYLKTVNAFVGLNYTVYVNGSVASNAIVANATGTAVEVASPLPGKTVFVRLYRNTHDYIDTPIVRFADLSLALAGGGSIDNAALGSTVLASIEGSATISTVEFYFDNVLVSRGSLGLHVLTFQDMGNVVFARVVDVDGHVYESPSYTVPL